MRAYGIAFAAVGLGLGLGIWHWATSEVLVAEALGRQVVSANEKGSMDGELGLPVEGRRAQREMATEAEVVEDTIHLDPAPDTGDCNLELRFVDRLSGAPASGFVQLWQVGIPEDREQTAGDERRKMGPCRDGVFTAKGLPPGSYRAYATFAAKGSTSDLTFEVKGGSTVLTLMVELPVAEDVFLRLVDVQGRTLRSEPKGELRMSGRRYSFRTQAGGKPSWAARRWNKRAENVIELGGGGGGGGGSHGAWKGLGPEDLGLDGVALGLIPGEDRATRTTYRWWFQRGQRKLGQVHLSLAKAGTYVGILVDREWILERLQVPHGVEYDLDKDVAIKSIACAASDGWMSGRVDFDFALEGCSPLHVEWSPRAAIAPLFVIERASSPSD